MFKQIQGKEKAKFLDPDFGPKDEKGTDLDGSKMSLYFTGEPPKGYVKPEDIVWLRPEQISVNQRPMFVSGDAGSNDVK